MTYIRPKFRHPGLPKNKLGYTINYYEGALSTLCAGCGHDSISAGIVQACYEMNIEPHRLAKMSGIGCSSKTPAYFLSNSHGFNSVHGRMPSVATGANLGNRDLIYLGVVSTAAVAYSAGLNGAAPPRLAFLDTFFLTYPNCPFLAKYPCFSKRFSFLAVLCFFKLTIRPWLLTNSLFNNPPSVL